MLDFDYIRFLPADVSTLNTPNIQLCINIPREVSNISLLISYLDSNFGGIKKADSSRYGNGNDLRLFNLGPIVLFSNFKMTTSSGKHLEVTSHAHILSSLYKLISGAENSDDLSSGFDRDCIRRQDELTKNKNIKGKCHLGIMLKKVFGFAELQEKATYGVGYQLTLTRNKDEAVFDKTVCIVDDRIEIDHIHWYAPQHTPSIQQEVTFSQQILSKTPTEPKYSERSVVYDRSK